MATKRRSLRVELIASLAIVLMMAAVSLSLTTELIGQRRHASQERQRLEDHARGLALIAAPLLGSGGAGQTQRSELEQILRPSLGALGIESVEIWSHDETPRALTSLGLAPPLPPPRPTLQEPPETHGELLVIDRPIPRFDRSKGTAVMTLRLVARPSPWTRTNDWQQTLVLALGVGVVLLVLGGLLLEVQVLRPLARLRETAAAVSLGDLQARAPEDGPAEVQGLARAFNAMTVSLQDKLQEIQAQRERLIRSEQLASVGRIAAGVAHEVGNPLAAIVGYVELLLDERTDPHLENEQRTLLERTRSQLHRIQSLVGQLLEYSRPRPQHISNIDVGELVRGLLGLLKHDARVEGIRLSVSGPVAVRARADSSRLEQVLQNLVINGCRATLTAGEDSPEVRIFVFRDDAGSSAVIDIQDSGLGVPDDIRPHLFEPFFTTAKAGEGTGLGLAISLGLVESMGGHLECLPPGQRPPLRPGGPPGAVFRLSLPLAPAGDNLSGDADVHP